MPMTIMNSGSSVIDLDPDRDLSSTTSDHETPSVSYFAATDCAAVVSAKFPGPGLLTESIQPGQSLDACITVEALNGTSVSSITYSGGSESDPVLIWKANP
jgi:hypothetical protein